MTQTVSGCVPAVKAANSLLSSGQACGWMLALFSVLAKNASASAF